MVYGRKYHTVEPENLTTEWLGPRMYRPDLHEMLQGALDAPREHKHYVTEFRYPEHGGFGAYLAGLRRGIDVRLGHGLIGLDPIGRTLRFVGGREVSAEAVISSIPLPELVPLIDGVPDAVRAAAEALSFSSTMLVNIGVGRADLSPAHVTYYYDETLSFPIELPAHAVATRGADWSRGDSGGGPPLRPLPTTRDDSG